MRWLFGKFKRSKSHSEINWPLQRPKTLISPGGFQKKLADYGCNNGDTYYLYKITENTIQYLLGKQVRKARYHKEEYLYLSDNGQYEPVTSDLLVRNRAMSSKKCGLRRIISYFHTPNEKLSWLNEIALVECVSKLKGLNKRMNIKQKEKEKHDLSWM